MICFRGMTFCSAKCAETSCHRQFTDKERAAAAKWWEGCKGEPPVAFCNFSVACPDYKPVETQGD